MGQFELFSFNNFLMTSLFEASTLATTGLPKKMVSAIHQKIEHKSEVYPELGYVNMSGRPVTLEYKYFRPTHDIEVPAPVTFTGRKVPPPPGVNRTAHYPDFAQYLQDLPNGPISVLITRPEDDIFLYLYFKKKWGGGPNEGGQQYAIIVWDKDKAEAVDLGFYGLTTEGVEKQLVRQVHSMKGGNTNQKVQEYVHSLGHGAPNRNNPVQAYEFEVTTGSREIHTTREAGKTVTGIDLVRVFADKYAKMVEIMSDASKRKLIDKIRIEGSNGLVVSNPNVPREISEFATALGVDTRAACFFLLQKMKEFRTKIWEEGGGSYQKASGYDLESENTAIKEIMPAYPLYYTYPTGATQKSERTPFGDTRIESGSRRARNVDPEKLQRNVPYAGKTASLPSIIKSHTLDGVMNRFAWFIFSGKIIAPVQNILTLLGIDPDDPGLKDLPDFENFTL